MKKGKGIRLVCGHYMILEKERDEKWNTISLKTTQTLELTNNKNSMQSIRFPSEEER